jgi:hypothetical protein
MSVRILRIPLWKPFLHPARWWIQHNEHCQSEPEGSETLLSKLDRLLHPCTTQDTKTKNTIYECPVLTKLETGTEQYPAKMSNNICLLSEEKLWTRSCTYMVTFLAFLHKWRKLRIRTVSHKEAIPYVLSTTGGHIICEKAGRYATGTAARYQGPYFTCFKMDRVPTIW